MRRAFIGLLLLVALGISVLAIGALASLDWDREHTKRTAALPPFAPERSGLVQLTAAGATYRARVAGLENDGSASILLHGFPETSATWQPLLDAAAQAGHRAIAFDQRGYSPSARPEEVSAYELPHLSADVLAIADAVGFERFHLVGHDWGAVVAWRLAALHPERLHSLSILAIPHPGASPAGEDEGPPTYVHFFRMPGLAEAVLSFGGFRLMRGGIYRGMPEPLVDEYLAVFSEPGALTSTLAWYRANDFASLRQSLGEISVPTRFLWGSHDFFTTPEILERQARLMTGPYRERGFDAGHWLIEDQPEAVVGEILELWAASDPAL
ncbi:MAG: alpha/beta hydrolase [Croceicoccus sp.]|nr:alpha/beta hydrolase [Croceicoccus sp.]